MRQLWNVPAMIITLVFLCFPQTLWSGGPVKPQGGYIAGDLHNHSTYSDGVISARVLIEKGVLEYGLGWFAQSGHGGGWNRDGRRSDFEYDGSISGDGAFWEESVSPENFKGDGPICGPYGVGENRPRALWKWQILQDFLYNDTWQASKEFNKPVWAGLEWNVPGHDHATAGIIAGQFQGNGEKGNADAIASFEYFFDMENNDLSEGGDQGWVGKVPNPPKDGANTGFEGHQKSVKAVKWMQKKFPHTGYILLNHPERRGTWNPNKGGNNNGWNIEHIRDLNNAGPDVCFGWEGQPGHQADSNRGGFDPISFGKGTYGGTGYYSAKIGHIWDALLGEGRHWWFFANSDWHRGLATGHSARDFWPGLYTKDYVWVEDIKDYDAQDIVDGIRSGNSFVVMGDLIDGLEFRAIRIKRMFRGWKILMKSAKKMGQILEVNPGDLVILIVMVRDPEGTNYCEYNFDNPSLAQLGISMPLNEPELHHVDLIGGFMTGPVDPKKPDYKNPSNQTACIVRQVLKNEMEEKQYGWKSFTYVYLAEKGKDRYFRLRGTNLPQGTPYETDILGNPLLDMESSENIPCDAPQCNNGKLDKDVEAWADLWFYSNPIFVKVKVGPETPAFFNILGDRE